MINKSKVFQKPKMMSVFIIMLFSLVMILVSPNIAFARGSNDWPNGVGIQKPPKSENPSKNPYFWGEEPTHPMLYPDDVKVNISNKAEIDEALLESQKSYKNRGDLKFSCFNKFHLLYSSGYGSVGYLSPEEYYNQALAMPAIPYWLTKQQYGGRVYRFFDYPGDTKNGGDDDFLFTFQARFQEPIRLATHKEENLYVNFVVDVHDTDGDHAHADLFNYIPANPAYYNRLAYLEHSENGKWKNWSSGWVELPKNASALDVRFYSTEGGGSGANDAELMMPRVLILDNSRPTIESVAIQSTGLTSSKNDVYDKENPRFRAKAEKTVYYIVTFDEPVRCTDVNMPWLKIASSVKNKKLIAKLASGERNNEYKKQFTFQYTLEEGDGIVPSGRVESIINANYFEDVGKNKCNEKDIAKDKFINKRQKGNGENVICDSTSPVIDINGQISYNTVFYARKMDAATWSGALYTRSTESNVIPPVLEIKDENLPGDRKYRQNTLFSLKSTDKSIFRVVLSDMIDNSLLKLSGELNTLALKLEIFDSKKNKIQDRYAYAELIAYRYVGQDIEDSCQGTNTGWTELYFAYTPNENDFKNLPRDVYSVDIAANIVTINGEEYFEFDTGLFNIKKSESGIYKYEVVLLNDFAGNVINQLTFPKKYVNLAAKAPADNIVKIDLESPELIEGESTLPDPEAPLVNLINGIRLVFKEKNTIEKVELQVVKPGGTGGFIPVRTLLGSKGSTSDQSSSISGGISPAIAFARELVGNKHEVLINNLYIIDENAAISDKYYLEYRVIDSAGNESTNKGEGFPLNLDILPPIPDESDGKWYDVERIEGGATADVTFDLYDASGIADNFHYVLDYNNRTTFPKGSEIKTSTDDDKVTITSNYGTRQSVTIWTKFSDTLGNIMKNFVPTNPIHLDTRKIDAEYYCSYCRGHYYGILQKTYDVSVKINKNPFSGTDTDEGTLIIKYKWLPEGKSPEEVAFFKELSFKSDQITAGMTVSLTPERFQEEWLAELGIQGSAFQGYYNCFAVAELWAELDGQDEVLIDTVDLYNHKHYFDNRPPTVSFRPFSEAYSRMPVVAFDLYDDGSAELWGSNIVTNMEYTYYTYAVKSIESGKEKYTGISNKYPIYTTSFSTNPKPCWNANRVRPVFIREPLAWQRLTLSIMEKPGAVRIVIIRY